MKLLSIVDQIHTYQILIYTSMIDLLLKYKVMVRILSISFMNDLWYSTLGLVISTPTGSTAYAMAGM